jgi:hypothetical protein
MAGAAPVAVNPHEGQVAIPYRHGEATHVVGCLAARAIRWAEEALGQSLDDVYMAYMRRAYAAASAAEEGIDAASVALPTVPMSTSATLVWAGIEHHRRITGGPGPEYTIDDVDAITEQIGADDLAHYALILLQLSLPLRKRLDNIDAAARAAGGAVKDPLMAAARGTGTSTLPPPSPQGFPPPPSGT